MKKHILFFIILLTFFAICIYNVSTRTYISAKFAELRPIKGVMPVYYKGLVVGSARERWHNDSYSHTFIKLVLYPKNLMLPKNTTVLLKKEKKNNRERDFLELIYPKEPSSIMLSNGAIINGIATVDLETFMANQHPDDLEAMRGNLVKASENLMQSLDGLNGVFTLISEILEDNRANIKASTLNFKHTTQNLNNMTKKVDNSINERIFNDTFSNIYSSTSRLDGTIEDFRDIMPIIATTLCEIEASARNVNDITCSVKKTLSKPFGGIHLFFRNK